MVNVQIEAHVDGLGTIIYCHDSAFDTASKVVLKKSDELIPFRDLAYARIKDAKAHDGNWKESSLCTIGSYVKEGSLFVPNASNKRIWLRESLVLKNPSDAVKAHKKEGEYLLKRFKVESHLEKIGKGNYFVLTDTTPVPTNRFGEDERTVWLFGDQAKPYGEFLGSKPVGISKSNIWMYTDNDKGNDKGIDAQSRPFANQLWLLGLGDNSNVGGDSRYLNSNSGVRGVRRESAEGGASKNADMYTSKEFLTASRNVGFVITGNLEKTLLAELDKLRK